jgi:hypothetical protein
MLGKRLNDREEGIGSEGGSFVGFGVENGGQFGHDF